MLQKGFPIQLTLGICRHLYVCVHSSVVSYLCHIPGSIYPRDSCRPNQDRYQNELFLRISQEDLGGVLIPFDILVLVYL